MRLREIASKTAKTLSPEELRVKSMADQAKKLNQQSKELRARQALTKAHEKVSKAKTRNP